MIRITFAELFGSDLSVIPDYLVKAAENKERLTVILPTGAEVVVMAVEDFEAMRETLAIAGDPDAVAAIRAGLDDLQDGRTVGVDEARRLIDEGRRS